MGRRTAIWFGVLVLMVTTGCGQGSGGGAGGAGSGGTAGGGGASSAAAGVAGRAFLSTSVTADGADRPLVPGSRIRLDFRQDGALGAQAGCNSMGGRYRLDGDRLVLTGPLASTQMGCSEPLMQQDTWLAGLLAAGGTLALDGDRLTLTSGGTVLSLLDERAAIPDSSLWETTWLLDAVERGDTAGSTVSSTVAGTRPWIRLVQGSRARVQVQTGCNTGSGPVEAGPADLTFGPVAVTRKGCADPAAAEVERAMLTVLQGDGPVRFAVKGEQLRLTRGDLTLSFRAGPTQTPDSAGQGVVP